MFSQRSVIASHSQACKTDSSRIVEHEINDEHVFVTTVDWTVARLAAITVNFTQTADGHAYARNSG